MTTQDYLVKFPNFVQLMRSDMPNYADVAQAYILDEFGGEFKKMKAHFAEVQKITSARDVFDEGSDEFKKLDMELQTERSLMAMFWLKNVQRGFKITEGIYKSVQDKAMKFASGLGYEFVDKDFARSFAKSFGMI